MTSNVPVNLDEESLFQYVKNRNAVSGKNNEYYKNNEEPDTDTNTEKKINKKHKKSYKKWKLTKMQMALIVIAIIVVVFLIYRYLNSRRKNSEMYLLSPVVGNDVRAVFVR